MGRGTFPPAWPGCPGQGILGRGVTRLQPSAARLRASRLLAQTEAPLLCSYRLKECLEATGVYGRIASLKASHEGTTTVTFMS